MNAFSNFALAQMEFPMTLQADAFAKLGLGDQLAQAWQRGLEAWWSTLLADGTRLSELGQRLAETGGAVAPGKPGLGELPRVLDALELIERRVSRLESEIQALAGGLSGLLASLEEQPRPPGGRKRRHR
jgi:hypothetical protein